MKFRFPFGILPGFIASILAIALTGCMTPEKQLQNVAKDWCMTIRASQVLPVYPLTEDLQPGDVFAVQTPLARQTEIYKKKGFLPLDQLVVRLTDMDYGAFYDSAYWEGTYSGAPHTRPGMVPGEFMNPVHAPKAAFPTYNFSVTKGSGLKMAIPVSGVPVALGYMGSRKATGSVTLSDAYTYGIDIEPAVRRLWEWWNDNLDVQKMMMAVARDSSEPVYLRCVTRVFIVRGIDVELANLESDSGGVDAGVPQEIKILDLSTTDPAKAAEAAQAYHETLATLAAAASSTTGGMPGGSFHFTQVSQRGVSMSQQFERPMVIGYLGFDVKVFRDGRLSAPIPSYAVLNDQVEGDPREALDFAAGELDEAYAAWLPLPGNRDRMVAWLMGLEINADPADLYASPKFHNVLLRADDVFSFSGEDPQ